jgi:hypothetical protein
VRLLSNALRSRDRPDTLVRANAHHHVIDPCERQEFCSVDDRVLLAKNDEVP